MSNSSSYEAAVSRLAAQSDAVGRLAQDSAGSLVFGTWMGDEK